MEVAGASRSVHMNDELRTLEQMHSIVGLH